MNNKKKVAVYVDGFNLYHGLKNLKRKGQEGSSLHMTQLEAVDNPSILKQKEMPRPLRIEYKDAWYHVKN